MAGWYAVLEQCFRYPLSKTLTALDKERYTIPDIQRGRDPVEYVETIAALCKNVEAAKPDSAKLAAHTCV